MNKCGSNEAGRLFSAGKLWFSKFCWAVFFVPTLGCFGWFERMVFFATFCSFFRFIVSRDWCEIYVFKENNSGEKRILNDCRLMIDDGKLGTCTSPNQSIRISDSIQHWTFELYEPHAIIRFIFLLKLV